MKENIQKIYNTISSQSPPWLQAIRAHHYTAFTQQNWPTRRQENWKYTDLQELAQQSFTQNLPKAIDNKEIAKYLLPDSYVLVFVNGYFASALSTQSLPSGVLLTNLIDGFKNYSDLLKSHYQNNSALALDNLNLALMQDGAFLKISKNLRLDKPIQLLFVTTHAAQTMQHLRNLIILEQGAQADIVETYVSLDESNYFNNISTQIILNANANLTYYKLQAENKHAYHIATTQINQAANSVCKNFNFSYGGKLARDDLQINFNETNAYCYLYGLYLIAEKQHIDQHTRIDHRVSHCQSEQLYKGILNAHATGVFNGKVMVHPQAQHTQARQHNQNLLLANSATMNTKPELEIYADDVQCAHGATVGQLDEQSLFYLRSRGIEQPQALAILTRAFASEILDHIANSNIKEFIDHHVGARHVAPVASGKSV